MTSSPITITAALPDGGDEILTPEALAFVADLHERFAARRDELLQARTRRRGEVARTGRLDFLPETAHITGRAIGPSPRSRRTCSTGGSR